MQSAQKKRLEEKNAKQIRELAALPSNRNCFECGQRGPTYVNITEGSFCCTGCSGILRGLNPPHRVKSISMASFTTDEVEKIRGLGNAENAKIWLALYGGSPPAMTNRDAIQTFLVKKYEKKAWYVSKAELNEQERLMTQAKEAASRTQSHDSITVASPPKSTADDLFSMDPFAATSSQQKATGNITLNSASQPFSPPAWMAPPPPFSFDDKITDAPVNPVPAPSQLPFPSTLPASNAFPTLPPSSQFSFGAPSAPATARAQPDPFADFENKFNDLTFRTSNTVSAFDNKSSLPAPNPLPKSVTVDSGIAALLQPTHASSNPFQLPTAPLAPVVPVSTVPVTSAVDLPAPNSHSSADKYSALAELDELFHHTGGSSHGDTKGTWMPSGFSTGIPPSTTTQSVQQQMNGAAKTTTNGFGSFPKSNTMGSIADYGVNNPFLTTQNNAYNMSATAFPNPFSTMAPTVPVAASAYPNALPTQQQQQWAMPSNSVMPAQPVIPPRPAAVSTSSTNWNPFL